VARLEVQWQSSEGCDTESLALIGMMQDDDDDVTKQTDRQKEYGGDERRKSRRASKTKIEYAATILSIE